MNIMNASLAD